MDALIVFVGGGLGALFRHLINGIAARYAWIEFPFHTLFINVSGSLVMGIVIEFAALKTGMSTQLRLFLATGILGGYTTFSTFSLEVAVLHGRGETGLAVLYVLLSVALGVGGLFAGMSATRALLA